MGIALSQIEVKDIVPKNLIFCRNIAAWGSEKKFLESKAVCFGDFGDSLLYIYCDGYEQTPTANSYLVKTSTSGVVTRAKLRLKFNKVRSVKVCGDRDIVMHQPRSPILCSVSFRTHELSFDAKLQNQPNRFFWCDIE